MLNRGRKATVLKTWQVPSWLLNRSRAIIALPHKESNRTRLRCPNIAKDLTLAFFNQLIEAPFRV